MIQFLSGVILGIVIMWIVAAVLESRSMESMDRAYDAKLGNYFRAAEHAHFPRDCGKPRLRSSRRYELEARYGDFSEPTFAHLATLDGASRIEEHSMWCDLCQESVKCDRRVHLEKQFKTDAGETYKSYENRKKLMEMVAGRERWPS